MLTEYSKNINDILNSHGYDSGKFKTAHKEEKNVITNINSRRITRIERESKQELNLTRFATRAILAGNRSTPEEPDPFRTCFEKDLDKIKHASSFRRLAGKCQVFLSPNNDMLRTRLTHSIEVAQIAKSISNYIGANSDLVEAIALAHDCGHGPGGHASEDAFSNFLPGDFDHAVWGSDVTLKPLNLCIETLDGVRNHSWKRPAPLTPEASIVSWADRIAYVCHDFSDALSEGIVRVENCEDLFTEIGFTQSVQIEFFINSIVKNTLENGFISMNSQDASYLEEFRDFNYQNIYLNSQSMVTYDKIVKLLSDLVDYYINNQESIKQVNSDMYNEAESVEFNAVNLVASMTDRFAINKAVELLGYSKELLPEIIY